jgi:hypothetical protein
VTDTNTWITFLILQAVKKVYKRNMSDKKVIIKKQCNLNICTCTQQVRFKTRHMIIFSELFEVRLGVKHIIQDKTHLLTSNVNKKFSFSIILRGWRQYKVLYLLIQTTHRGFDNKQSIVSLPLPAIFNPFQSILMS